MLRRQIRASMAVVVLRCRTTIKIVVLRCRTTIKIVGLRFDPLQRESKV